MASGDPARALGAARWATHSLRLIKAAEIEMTVPRYSVFY